MNSGNEPESKIRLANSVDLFYFGVSSSVSAGAQSENPTTSRVARVIILIISAQIWAKNLRVPPEWQKCVEKCIHR
jgi:hypothetical protein